MNCLLQWKIPLLWLLLLVVQLVQGTAARQWQGPMVSTNLGRIKGSIMQSFQGRAIYAFRGIRYAQPPVGGLRFEPPKAVRSWGRDIVHALEDSLICPQHGKEELMSEDCLKLNVFTHNLTGESPVLVYIHGGANVLGSGHSEYEAGPEYLLDHDVVLVAFNYRLGALGFLSGGNYGYLDQVMVLEWVRSHISHFGGNRNLVTILGMSAGSMAVSLHLASPLSTGLFHRAIMMSGSATNHYSIHNLFWTRLLARQVGCPMYDSFAMTECLRRVSWQRIVSVCASWEQYKFVNMKWNYEIDGYFMHRHPTSLVEMGEFNHVPVLVTFTANELDYSTLAQADNDLLLLDINLNFHDYAPEMFLFDFNPMKSTRIKDYYFGKMGDLSNESIESFGHIFSDAIIGHGVHRFVELARRFTPVYYALMEYVGQRSLTVPMGMNGKLLGVGHADDLQYIMPGISYGSLMEPNHTDLFMMQRMTTWFTHFARTGRPMEEAEAWPACNYSYKVLMHNRRVPEMGLPVLRRRYALWDKLFPLPSGQAGICAGQVLLVLLARLM